MEKNRANRKKYKDTCIQNRDSKKLETDIKQNVLPLLIYLSIDRKSDSVFCDSKQIKQCNTDPLPTCLVLRKAYKASKALINRYGQAHYHITQKSICTYNMHAKSQGHNVCGHW